MHHTAIQQKATGILWRSPIGDRGRAILVKMCRQERAPGWAFVSSSITCSLLVLSLAVLQSSTAHADLLAESASGDPLPNNALFRLGTDRFRQEGEVMQVKYSSDGKKLASISRDSIIIWEASTGRPLKLLRPKSGAEHSRNFSAISFSPDGEEIAAADGSRAYVWDVESGHELLSFPVGSNSPFDNGSQISYSPNGERLAIGCGTSVQLFDMVTGKQTKQLTIENHNAAFYGICWTPDGTHLSAATMNPAVVTWNVETGELARRFKVQKDDSFSYCPTMSADGKTLVAASHGVVNLWQFATGEHIKDIKCDADHINTLVLTPDNKTLIVGSQDCMIRTLNVETGQLLRKIDGRLWIGRSIAVSPDFKTVALGAVFPTIRQWDISTGEQRFPELTSHGHDAEVRCVAYSPDGRLIASGGPNKQVNLWDANTGKLRQKIAAESSANRVAFTPSGEKLLTSWENSGTIRVYDVATGKAATSIESGMKKVRTFGLTPNGKQLIAVASDSKYGWHSPVAEEAFQVWDFESGKKLRSFTFPTASTETMAPYRRWIDARHGSGQRNYSCSGPRVGKRGCYSTGSPAFGRFVGVLR